MIALIAVLLVIAPVACGDRPTSTTAATVVSTGTTGTTTTPAVVSPTLPDVIPAYGEVDPATGLHITGTPKEIDVATWHLEVTGKVAKELSLTYAELLALPKVTARPVLECPGEFVDTATWSGVQVKTIVDMAGVQPGAVSLIMSGADGYSTTINLEDATKPECFLAYELEGKPLPALQGFPVRAVFPGKYGAYWVKWLLQIEVR